MAAARIGLGHAYIQQERQEDAEDTFLETCPRTTHLSDLHILFGRLHLSEGYLDEPEDEFLHAIAINPYNYEALAALSMV